MPTSITLKIAAPNDVLDSFTKGFYVRVSAMSNNIGLFQFLINRLVKNHPDFTPETNQAA